MRKYEVEVLKSENAIAVRSNDTFNANMLNSFIEFLDVAPKTAEIYKRAIKQFFTYLKVNNIPTPTHNDIVNYKRYLEAKGRKPATIALYLASTRRFFQWTEQNGIYQNITVGVKAPKLERGHKKDYFAANQVKNILTGIDRSNVEGLRNYAILALMTTGGLRTVEVARANVEDLRVVSGMTVLYVQGKGRNDKQDFIKLTPQVEEAIRTYFKARGDVEATEPLFVSESKRNHGRRLTTRTISGVCKNSMRNAGYNSDRLTAHSLRHTAVTLALLNGQSLEEVQHFARHHNISTTQIYAHNIDRIKSQCEQSIANAIF